MRIHRDNTIAADPMFRNVDYGPGGEYFTGYDDEITEFNSIPRKTNNYIHAFEIIYRFQKDLEKISRVKELMEKFELVLRRILPIREVNLFFFDDTKTQVKPIADNDSGPLKNSINMLFAEGRITPLFNADDFQFFPDMTVFNKDGNKRNFLLFPIKEAGKSVGLFAGLTTLDHARFDEIDKKALRILLNQVISKLDQLTHKAQLSKTIGDLHAFQAKLNDDYHLSAVGELSLGVFDEIASPLQIILSQTDMLLGEDEQTPELMRIKTQVKRIKSTLNRLIKFTNIEKNTQKLESVFVNRIVRDFYAMTKSTFDNNNLECALDLDEDIPPILSNEHYIYQILTNVIELIKHNKKQTGGIIIQSKFVNNDIIVNITTTTKLSYVPNAEHGKSGNLRFRIIEYLMKKHEGSCEIDFYAAEGAKITLNFPLLRKVRK